YTLTGWTFSALLAFAQQPPESPIAVPMLAFQDSQRDNDRNARREQEQLRRLQESSPESYSRGKSYPSSRWLDDAKALQVEIRSQSGQPVSPETATDEDLKLLALNSLMNTDPERSIPMLEKLLKSSNSPKLKERALFVLAQSQSPASRDLVAGIAKGGSNPDLQSKAIEYLGIHGGHDNLQLLVDVYKSSNDPQVKRTILNS